MTRFSGSAATTSATMLGSCGALSCSNEAPFQRHVVRDCQSNMSRVWLVPSGAIGPKYWIFGVATPASFDQVVPSQTHGFARVSPPSLRPPKHMTFWVAGSYDNLV